jgi:drug/metabolite transporter (DMT)-like permease
MILKYLGLFGVFFIYSLSGLFSKSASRCEFLSWSYLCFLSGCVFVLGIYAILWQQVIKRMPVSDANILGGVTTIFGLMIAHFVFDEPITFNNIIGTIIIISGMTLYARA